jgi:hypothetical protein
MSPMCKEVSQQRPLLVRSSDRRDVLASTVATTAVPDKYICKLSFYIKCCIIGCGIQGADADPELLDYANAYKLPLHLQRAIFELAFHEFNTEKLVDRFYFLDDRHRLLPEHLSNIFVSLVAAGNVFPVERDVVVRGRKLRYQNTMLCTSEWLNEMYISPLCAIQRFLPPPASPAVTSPDNAWDDSCCRGKHCVLNQCIVCPDYALCKNCCIDHDHNPDHPLGRTKRARLSATTDSITAHDPQVEVRPEMVSSYSSSYRETSTATASKIGDETTS